MEENNNIDAAELYSLTADIVSSHVSNNQVQAEDVPNLIRGVFETLCSLKVQPEAEPEELKPAVPIKKSITRDYIICLEDGKKMKMLKRYLSNNYNMTPDEYRAKWSLPSDYPMVAPSYAKQRQELAMKFGLGRGNTRRRKRA